MPPGILAGTPILKSRDALPFQPFLFAGMWDRLNGDPLPPGNLAIRYGSYLPGIDPPGTRFPPSDRFIRHLQ